MQGVILAGGSGSRLYPLTKVTNKHLLPVGRYPMIYYAIHALRAAGMTDIAVVSGREHLGSVVALLGSGREFGVSFSYRVQDRAGGIAEALALVEPLVRDDLMCVILGDNIFSTSLRPYVEAFQQRKSGAKILLKAVADPHRFGVPEIANGQIVSIEEKPTHPKSRYAVTGIYLYDPHVFDIIRTLTRSARGELEITDVNNDYLRRKALTYDLLDGWWTDAGTPDSYQIANELARDLVFADDFGRET